MLFWLICFVWLQWNVSRSASNRSRNKTFLELMVLRCSPYSWTEINCKPGILRQTARIRLYSILTKKKYNKSDLCLSSSVGRCAYAVSVFKSLNCNWWAKRRLSFYSFGITDRQKEMDTDKENHKRLQANAAEINTQKEDCCKLTAETINHLPWNLLNQEILKVQIEHQERKLVDLLLKDGVNNVSMNKQELDGAVRKIKVLKGQLEDAEKRVEESRKRKEYFRTMNMDIREFAESRIQKMEEEKEKETIKEKNDGKKTEKQQHQVNVNQHLAEMHQQQHKDELMLTNLLLSPSLLGNDSFVTNQSACENLLKRRFLVSPAFEIYGGVGGLYDFGPAGCAMKTEVEALWRKHFVLHDDLMELNGPSLTPYSVLKASGHVDRFTDIMVQDCVTGESFRADHLLAQFVDEQLLLHKTGMFLETPSATTGCTNNTKVVAEEETARKLLLLKNLKNKMGDMSLEELCCVFREVGIVSPAGNRLGTPFQFNLMFSSHIGPVTAATTTTGTDKASMDYNSNCVNNNDNENKMTTNFVLPVADYINRTVTPISNSPTKGSVGQKPRKIVGSQNNNEDKLQHTKALVTSCSATADSSAAQISGLCYLRPETAQGIFVNFRKFLTYNGGKIPFGVAQVGLAFRNEISARQGLIRAREFQLAEIEYFHDPTKTKHPKFESVAMDKLPLYSRERQSAGGPIEHNLSLRDAVSKCIVANENLAYFMSRAYSFLIRCGLRPDCIRFRQHLLSEMAHYSIDCWDAEVLTSKGWLEVAGLADRSAFDLQAHASHSKTDLSANRELEAPVEYTTLKMVPNMKVLSGAFCSKINKICKSLFSLTEDQKIFFKELLDSEGSFALSIPNDDIPSNNSGTEEAVIITKDMVSFEKVYKVIHKEAYIPNVIEPSFGIGRIMYCIFEHTFCSRKSNEKESRNYLALPTCVAPIKCSVLPLSADEKLDSIVKRLYQLILDQGISCIVDYSSASIGKRYARTDEIGIPFAITVDFETLTKETVTIRERDSMLQCRVRINDVPTVLLRILHQSNL